MKPVLAILSQSALLIACVQSAVISLDVGVSALSYTAKAFDIDGDGITDFTFRGNGGICTDDYPASICVFAVTLQGREGVEFLFDSSLGGPARPLVSGDILGSSSPGAWGSSAYYSLHVSSVMRLHDPDPANSGYAAYLGGFEVYSIGFRQPTEGDQFRYGWIDVALFMSLIGGDESTPDRIPIPGVMRIHYADTPGEDVVFTPIPEPSSIALLAASGALILKRGRRTRPPTE